MARFAVRQQTEGALLAALGVVLSLATLLPLAGIFFGLVAPVPFVMSARRHGIRHCLVTALVAAGLLTILMGPAVALRFSTLMASTGVLIGTISRMGYGPRKTLVVGSLANVVLYAIMVYIAAWTMGLSGPFSDVAESMAETWTKTKATMRSMPMFGDMLDRPAAPPGPGLPDAPTMEQMLDTQFEAVDALFRVPIYFIVGGGIFSFVVMYLVANWVMKRFDMALPPLAPLREVYVPSWLAFLLVASVLFGGPHLSKALFLNLMAICFGTFQFMGLAAMSAWLHRKGVGRPARWAIYLVSLILPFTQPWVLLLGVVDSTMGLRDPSLMPREDEAAPPGDDHASDGESENESAGGEGEVSPVVNADETKPKGKKRGRRGKSRSLKKG